MIEKYDLIAGSIEDVREYIESLETFKHWGFCKDYHSQVKRLLARNVLFDHIGAVMYQGEDEDGAVVFHAAFVAITTPNRFL